LLIDEQTVESSNYRLGKRLRRDATLATASRVIANSIF
jgi:hypothetical protein